MRNIASIILIFGVVICAFSDSLEAEQVTSEQAQDAVQGWLKLCPEWSGFSPWDEVESIDVITNDDGVVLCYAANFIPTGFVIVSANSQVEPILCFSRYGSYNPSSENLLGQLITDDLTQRFLGSQSSSIQMAVAADAVRDQIKLKWDLLTQSNLPVDDEVISAMGISGITDIRVEPLVLSQWDQGSVCGLYCFNYYTPNHYYAGCVATAMAQLMRYYQHPQGNIPQLLQYYQVNGGGYQWVYPRGGDGGGGAYDWDQMVLAPDCGITDLQREAIGALCYDAAISVNMNLTAAISIADPLKAKDALTSLFDYDNAVKAFFSGSGSPHLHNMINPNLDAGYPVIIGIRDDLYNSHAILVDGYGYDQSSLYHHLNMGWGGTQNVWYNLPDIDSSPAYTVISQCIYNIFVTGTGEIISGRVTDLTGQPVSGAAVTAKVADGPEFNSSTNQKGIYAMAQVPSNTDFTIRVSKPGYYFLSQNVTTGYSSDYSYPSGNLGAVDFAALPPSPPVSYDDNIVIAKDSTPVTITLNGNDEGHPNPPSALSYVIVTLPEYGILEDPATSQIQDTDLPYTLSASGNQVDYTFYSSYSNDDSFVFQTDDGGSAPEGGLSNTATVYIDIEPPVLLAVDFEAGVPNGWTIVDGTSDGYTWSWFDQGAGQGHCMIADSMSANGAMLDEQLITASLNLANRNNITLSFEHEFLYDTEETIADVDIRVNQGNWQNIARYQGDNSSGPVVFDITALAADQSDVQIRWHYYNAEWDIHWKIDNVAIRGSCRTDYAGDLVYNCGVDLMDLTLFNSFWLESTCNILNGWCNSADINHDTMVNFYDYTTLFQDWLMGVDK